MTDASYEGPLPIRQPESDFYWERTRAHELWVRNCDSCKAPYFYPRDFCPSCGSNQVSWLKCSGKGILHTFAIVERSPIPAFRDKVPFVVAIVELAEGPRLPTNLVGVAAVPNQITVGMEVEVVFEDLTEEITLPVFRPVRQ